MTFDFTTPSEVRSLIHHHQPTFYPARIPQEHPQLKNHIGLGDGDLIYYASEHEIYALHLKTRKRELIKSIPWSSRCMSSGHGWICVGGDDNGQCAFISIDRDRHERTTSQPSAEVDDVLPLNLDPNSRALTHHNFDWIRSQVSPPPKYELQSYELGGNIVNSVTISSLPSDQEGLDGEVVAVMTNNDRTVRIFSLTQSCLVATLDYPFCMNHASISPDGNLLLAVGDASQIFFHQRIYGFKGSIEGHRSLLDHQWQPLADFDLRLVSTMDPDECCFSTAFSPSGHLSAVATQGGLTAIISTSSVQEGVNTDEAVVCVMRTSRPKEDAGAIRSLSFSPSPWDLLAWTEDQGRVCVVNLRNSFRSKQIIELDTASPMLRRVTIEDQQSTLDQRQIEIERRLTDTQREAIVQDRSSAVSRTADLMEHAAEQRRSEREIIANDRRTSRESPHRLTDSEHQMIDTIGLRRMHANSDHDLMTPPASGAVSINYSASDRFLMDTQTSSWLYPSTLQRRSTANIAEYMRQRNLERSRSSNSYQPHRRSSVVIPNTDSISSFPPESTTPTRPAAFTLSASPSRLPAASNPPIASSDEPWLTISEAMGTNPDRRDDAGVTAARAMERHAQQPQSSQRWLVPEPILPRIERPNVSGSHPRRMRPIGRGDSGYVRLNREILDARTRFPDEPTTMGIGWSDNGMNLYVAVEEGIFEYSVNIELRKQFPGMALM